MKKTLNLFLFFTISLIFSSLDAGAFSWWKQSTICRINPTSCYIGMGIGYDSQMWDATGNCRGMKMICPEAIIANETYPIPISKLELVNKTGIVPDFDTAKLNKDCFGVRKTSGNGSMASVDGNFIKVWCQNILDNPDEFLPTGEITFGAQPKCKDIASDGWVATLNQKCYGKYYNPSNYYIECEGDNEIPKKIIVLNGADAITGTSGGGLDNYPTSDSAANTLFDKMQLTSTSKRQEHFVK